jgi:hypothetical protein
MTKPERETRVKKRTNISSSGAQSARSWICRVVSEHGREAPVGSTPIVVGAGSGCDLVLHDDAVSRRHAEILLVADGIRIKDLGSTNGIYYRSSRVESVVITSDATLVLGNTHLEITRRVRPSVTPSTRSRFGGLIGRSIAMREVFAGPRC